MDLSVFEAKPGLHPPPLSLPVCLALSLSLPVHVSDGQTTIIPHLRLAEDRPRSLPPPLDHDAVAAAAAAAADSAAAESAAAAVAAAIADAAEPLPLPPTAPVLLARGAGGREGVSSVGASPSRGLRLRPLFCFTLKWHTSLSWGGGATNQDIWELGC